MTALQEKFTDPIALGDGGYLRPLGIDDVTATYVNGLNDDDVRQFMTATRRTPATEANVRDYVAQHETSADSVLFGLFVDNALGGTVRLHAVNNGTANIGIAIFEKSLWGRGWGRRAVSGVVAAAQNRIGLKRIVAGIYARNETSQRTFAAAGFRCTNPNHHSDDLGISQTWVRES